jgi:hypothetical protein
MDINLKEKIYEEIPILKVINLDFNIEKLRKMK